MPEERTQGRRGAVGGWMETCRVGPPATQGRRTRLGHPRKAGEVGPENEEVKGDGGRIGESEASEVRVGRRERVRKRQARQRAPQGVLEGMRWGKPTALWQLEESVVRVVHTPAEKEGRRASNCH